MLALTLMDHSLRHRAQNADVTCPTPRIAARAPQELIDRLRGTAPAENPEPDEA
jgi:chorismate synthase